jgi:CheY-like chemotaxis protein
MLHADGASSTQHTDAVKTIVLVEDDDDIGLYINLALQQETSYHVLFARNPYEAYRVVFGLIPSLFIIDYQLPVFTGIDLYDRLHANPTLAHVPALIISANLPRQAIRERKLASLSKPFDLDTLLEIIHRMVETPSSSHNHETGI